MIAVENLTKNHLRKQNGAFAGIGSLRGNGLSFEVNRNEIFGIIGPDGAGKSTLFRILATLLLPDSGTARIKTLDAVKDYKAIRKIVGYMPGTFSLYQDLSVAENLRFFATIFHTTIAAHYHLIEPIYKQLEPFNQRLAGALSGGMKQKLALCCALIHKPEILILDEPTTGVDPVSRTEFWDMLHRLKQEDITILVSTAYMDEASRCNRIALMQNGQFISVSTPSETIARYKQTLWKIHGNPMFDLLLALRQHDEIHAAFAFGDVHHITVSPRFSAENLKTFLTGKGISDIQLSPCTPTVEDCFMELSKQPHQP